jgi:hypothetical protein
MKIFATDFEDNLLRRRRKKNSTPGTCESSDDNYLSNFFCARIPRLKEEALAGISSSSAKRKNIKNKFYFKSSILTYIHQLLLIVEQVVVKSKLLVVDLVVYSMT